MTAGTSDKHNHEGPDQRDDACQVHRSLGYITTTLFDQANSAYDTVLAGVLPRMFYLQGGGRHYEGTKDKRIISVF